MHSISTPSGAPDQPVAHRWLILGIVSVALLLIVIDMTVLYTALPRLTHDLAATASHKLWIVNIYGLVVSGLLLGTGTLGDRLGHRRLFIAGMLVFGVASLLAAFSPSTTLLIAARAVLGVGAAMMMPATLSLIRQTFSDEREHALAIGIWASVASGGAAFGPVVGGVLLEHFWWGSVFLINVPIMLVALVLALRYIPRTSGFSSQPWDWLGSLQVMVGLVACTYAIKEAGKARPDWATAAVALVIGVVAMGIFIRAQRRSPHPLLDLSLFRIPRFSIAVMAALVSSASLLGMQLVFSQRLQLVEGYSPLQAGLAIVPLPIAAFVAGPIAGRLLHAWGGGVLMSRSLLMCGVGMGGYWLMHEGATLGQIPFLLILGFGVGAVMTAASATILTSAPVERAGMASSVEEVTYELGGALGVTLMGSLLSFVYALNMPLPAGSTWPEAVRDSLDEALLVAEDMPGEPAYALVQAAQSAFNQGFHAVLISATVLLFVAAAVAMLVPDRQSSGNGAGG